MPTGFRWIRTDPSARWRAPALPRCLRHGSNRTVAQSGLKLASDVATANTSLLQAINNNIFTAAQYAQQQETQRAQAQASAAGGGLCFITTACCDAAGLPDDCDILTAMRAFRDDVMMCDPQMRELVELYYEKAPEVVAFFMYNVSDARAFWKSVKSFWIDPIYSSLMYGDYESAVNKYLGMFVALENVMNSWQYESARNS